MKKIFTLLFCVMAMGFAANAADDANMVYRCMDALLNQEQPTTIMAANLDANNDGEFNIADVTTLIDMRLQASQVRMAPAQKGEVQTIIDDMLNNEPPTPSINKVTEAVDKTIEKN